MESRPSDFELEVIGFGGVTEMPADVRASVPRTAPGVRVLAFFHLQWPGLNLRAAWFAFVNSSNVSKIDQQIRPLGKHTAATP